MEAKFVQQLALFDYCPLFDLFLDLRKAYGAMDRGLYLQTLEDLVRPWAATGFLSRLDVTSVEAVIREWDRIFALCPILLGEIRTLVAIFYAIDGLIAAHDPKILQTTIDLFTGLFDRVGLQIDTKKTEAMTFLPGMRDSWNVRWHFSYPHHKSRVSVAGECFCKCCICGIQVSTPGTPAQEASKTCRQAMVARHQNAVAAEDRAALRHSFSANGKVVNQARTAV